MVARLAFLLLMILPLATGCAAQRDSTGNAPPPLGPNLPVVLYGSWEFTMTHPEEVLTGVFSIPEEGEGHVTASNGLDAPVAAQRADVTGQTFRVSGVVQAERGPLSFTLTGIIQGDEMTGEAEVGGVTYKLTATRVHE